MIAEIIKGKRCENFIDYNESKVEQGVAERIFSCTSHRDPSSIKSLLNNSVALNQRVKKNRFQHVMVSFHSSDNITTDRFLDIWTRYSQEMKFDNSHHVIYEHNDTHLKHFHIVMPTVDFEGNKISEYQDFKRNRDTCRMLEKELGLYQIQYEEMQQKKVNAKNASIYSIYNYLKSTSAEKQQTSILPASFQNSIIKYKMSNHQIRDNYPGYIDNRFEELLNSANEATINKKQSLIDQIREVKRGSNDYTEFEQKVKSLGLYVRRVKIDQGYKMIYGNPSDSLYIKDRKLPKDIRYDYLFNSEKKFALEDQKKFIKNIAIRAMNNSKNWNEFSDYLDRYNIAIETSSNKNGIYAYALKSLNIKDGEFIPASKVDQRLTMAKLKAKFKDTGLSTITTLPRTDKNLGKELSIAVAKAKSVSRNIHDDRETTSDEIRKKKLQQQEREDEQDRGQ